MQALEDDEDDPGLAEQCLVDKVLFKKMILAKASLSADKGDSSDTAYLVV